jgi:predicted ferric reductase
MTLQLKIIITGALFVLIFILGYWLHHLDKPYPTSWLTIHKLLSLAVLIFLARTLMQNGALETTDTARSWLLISTGVLWVLAILSGGFLSMDREWPPLISTSHQILPYMTLAMTIWCVYEVLFKEHSL